LLSSFFCRNSILFILFNLWLIDPLDGKLSFDISKWSFYWMTCKNSNELDMQREADLSLHFLRGILDCFMTRVTSMAQRPAWIVPLMEFSWTVISIWLWSGLLMFVSIQISLHRMLIATIIAVADLCRSDLASKGEPRFGKLVCLGKFEVTIVSFEG
jgi:hypothetical protein